ncbi:MAG: hypothetical protein M3R25_09920, partial [Bacteroidota bacterium]|nr:hypothetical protein [Bacteroidota bacterium]
MTNNYLRFSVIGILFLIPLVAFIVSTNLYFPYITGKNLMFRLLVEIAFILYFILAVRAPEFRPRLTSIFLAFSTFIAIILVADVFGIYPFKSFWSNFERMEGFITHLHLFAYFIMMTSLLNGEKIWTKFFQVTLGVSVIMGLLSFDPEKLQAGRFFAQLGNST